MRGSHPLPDQLPGEHTGCMPRAAHRSSWYNCLHCCHSHTHSHMVTADRSMVVVHVPMVHTCSFMCTNHIDMIATPQPFYELGSTPVIWTSIMQAEYWMRDWLVYGRNPANAKSKKENNKSLLLRSFI